jgi:hypothetical protein
MPATNPKRNLVIALDFDGVVVTDRFPSIGRPTDAHLWLRQLDLEFQPKVILWTSRSDEQPYLKLAPEGIERIEGPFLSEALAECKRQGIRLWAVNGNPQQAAWTTSNKIHADIYIDDRAVGVPLITFAGEPKPCVNWNLVGPKLHWACYHAAYPEGQSCIDPANMA